MTDQSWWAYALMFLVPVGLTTVFTPIAMNVAHRLGILDHPGPAKVHKSPVPYLGGAAIVVTFSAMVIVAALVTPPIDGGLPDLVIFLGMAVGLALVGLIDDIRNLSPWVRLVLEVGAGFGVWATGTGIRLPLPEPFGAIATMVWVVVVTNAFNLLDNMDGLSAGVAGISSMFLFIIAISDGRFLIASLALALAGCSLGFLRHNFHPARIYMGDAGSLFIGFVLAVITLKLRDRTGVSILVPGLILGVPFFDTTLVMFTRVLNRRSPFQGGKDHVSHRLVFVGVPVWASVSLIYAGAIGLGWLAIVMEQIKVSTGLILMGLIVSVALFLGVILATVPVYGTSAGWRRRSRNTAPRSDQGVPAEVSLTVDGLHPSDTPDVLVPVVSNGRWEPADSLRQLLGDDFFNPDPGRWRMARERRQDVYEPQPVPTGKTELVGEERAGQLSKTHVPAAKDGNHVLRSPTEHW